MDDVLPKPALLSLPPNGEGDLWRSAVVVAVAPDGDGLLPKRPVGCVNEGGAVGGAPKPPKAGVAREAKMPERSVLLEVGGSAKIFEVLVVLVGAGLAKRLEVVGLLDGVTLPKRLVLLDGAALPKRLELFVLLGAALLEPKRPVPGSVVKVEAAPNPPPLEGRSNRLPFDVLGAGAGVVEDPKAGGALLVGAGLEPNKPAADPKPLAPAVFGLVLGTLLAEAGAVVDPAVDALVVGAGLDPNKAPPATFGLASEVLLAEAGLVLPKLPTVVPVAAAEPWAEAGRVTARTGIGEVVAVAVVELEVAVVLAEVGAVPNEKGLLVLLAGFGVGFEAGALVVGTGALPLEENKLDAVLPVVVLFPGRAGVEPKSPLVGAVAVGPTGAAVSAAAAGCGGGRGNGAGGFPCVGDSDRSKEAARGVSLSDPSRVAVKRGSVENMPAKSFCSFWIPFTSDKAAGSSSIVWGAGV